MPGIGGFILPGQKITDHLMKKFEKKMFWGNEYFSLKHKFPNTTFMNVVSNPIIPASLVNWNGRYYSFFYGEIYPAQEFKSESSIQAAHLNLVTNFIETNGNNLCEVDGTFLLSIWDDKAKKLYLANDLLGQFSLNYFFDGQRFIYSSQSAAILQLLEQPTLDEKAFAEWLTLGTILNGQTHFKNINRLLPGSVLTFANSELKLDTYFKSEYVPQPSRTFSQRLSDINAQFEASVLMRYSKDERTAVALSGGFDSRAVWSVYLNKNLQASAVTRGAQDSADMEIARQITDQLHIDHQTHIITNSAYEEFPYWATQLIQMSEGWMRLSSAFLFSYYNSLSKKFDVLIDAAGGAMLRRQHARRYGMPFSGSKEIRDFTYQLYLQNIVKSGVVSKEFIEEFIPSVQADIDDYFQEKRDSGSDEDLLDMFYLEQICGLKGSADLMFQSHFINCRQPFYDRMLLNSTRKFSVKERKSQGIHSSFIKYFYPELAQFPLESNDLIIPFKNFTYKRLGAILLHRLSNQFHLPNKKMIPTLYPLWNPDELLNNELFEFTQNILEDSRTLNRSYFSADKIRSMMQRQKEKTGNHANTLFQVMNVELFLREFIDK